MKIDCTIVESARLLDNAIRNEKYSTLVQRAHRIPYLFLNPEFILERLVYTWSNWIKWTVNVISLTRIVWVVWITWYVRKETENKKDYWV